MRLQRMQVVPNIVTHQRAWRVCLNRLFFCNRDRTEGAMLSTSVCVEPRDLWIGAYWETNKADGDFFLFVCLLPCFPIRFHWKRSRGGVFG
jgi:hypothetical protein